MTGERAVSSCRISSFRKPKPRRKTSARSVIFWRRFSEISKPHFPAGRRLSPVRRSITLRSISANRRISSGMNRVGSEINPLRSGTFPQDGRPSPAFRLTFTSSRHRLYRIRSCWAGAVSPTICRTPFAAFPSIAKRTHYSFFRRRGSTTGATMTKSATVNGMRWHAMS